MRSPNKKLIIHTVKEDEIISLKRIKEIGENEEELKRYLNKFEVQSNEKNFLN